MSVNQRTSATFKQGVEAFWNWFPTVADRFYETIERSACAELTDETVDFMSQHLPGLSWAFGPGENDGHSFTVSGEGLLPKQLLAQTWLASAFEVDGWTFYSSRQPSPAAQLANLAISVGKDQQIDMESLLVQTQVDEENEKINLAAWHPAFEHLPESDRFQILFLLLDEALGEFGTQMWIGPIDIRPVTTEQPHTRSMAELPKYIESVDQYHGWKKLPPTESYTVYKMPGDLEGPRGDTIAGSSRVMSTIEEFLSQKGNMEENPLGGTMASLAYLQIDEHHFPEGQQADVRGRMEDAINKALESQAAGTVVGGASGLDSSYIDVLLMDGENSLAIVREQLNELKIPEAEIHFFA